MRLIASILGLGGVLLAFYTAIAYLFMMVIAPFIGAFMAMFLVSIGIPLQKVTPIFTDIQEQFGWTFLYVFLPGLFIFSFICCFFLALAAALKRYFGVVFLLLSAVFGIIFAAFFNEKSFLTAMILCMISGVLFAYSLRQTSIMVDKTL